jgi:hypothetical protein
MLIYLTKWILTLELNLLFANLKFKTTFYLSISDFTVYSSRVISVELYSYVSDE